MIFNRVSFIGIISISALGVGCGSSLQIPSQAPAAKAAATEIVGGSTVAAKDPVAASTVALLAFGDEDGAALCTGSLIAEDMIVTAAHCLAGTKSMVVLFATDINGKSEDDIKNLPKATVTAAVAHSQYNSRASADRYDIAILKFKGVLPAGYRAATPLPANFKLTKSTKALLAGYGVHDASEDGIMGNATGVLRKASVKILGAVGKTEFAVEKTIRGAECSGDSGGPAFVQQGKNLYLFGVTSRGDHDADGVCRKGAGIYTFLNAHAKWVNDTMIKLRAK